MRGLRVAAVMDGDKLQGLITLDDINEVFHVMSAAARGGYTGRRSKSSNSMQPESQSNLDATSVPTMDQSDTEGQSLDQIRDDSGKGSGGESLDV